MRDTSNIGPVISSQKQPLSQRSVTIQRHSLVIILVVIVLCGVSFAGGIAYEKGHTHNSSTAATANGLSGHSGLGAGGGRFGGRRGGLGLVTAISNSSISVQNQRTGTNTTFTINSSTTITDNGQTVSASTIKSGDTVVVSASSSNPTTATNILVNPSTSGGGSVAPTPNSSGGPATVQ